MTLYSFYLVQFILENFAVSNCLFFFSFLRFAWFLCTRHSFKCSMHAAFYGSITFSPSSWHLSTVQKRAVISDLMHCIALHLKSMNGCLFIFIFVGCSSHGHINSFSIFNSLLCTFCSFQCVSVCHMANLIHCF